MNARQLRELLGPLAEESAIIGAPVGSDDVTARERFRAQERHRSAMRVFWIVSGVAAVAGIYLTHRRLEALEDRKR